MFCSFNKNNGAQSINLTHRLGDCLKKGTKLIDCIRLRSILSMAIACSPFLPGNLFSVSHRRLYKFDTRSGSGLCFIGCAINPHKNSMILKKIK